ncbi:transcription-repair coupling factor [Rubricoccus marinus]|uniref:Transcription-repair-coupling factor n=1 Tax=Rubricoccus marinus TaxID=716817 RepID=A0A259U416_9BACT|nr:transcription-repair coupling factor [Rubricoccus marinus]
MRDLVASQSPFEFLRQRSDGMAPGQTIRVKGAAGSLPAFALADILEASGGPIIALLPESESADYLRSDLEQLLGGDDQVLFFPPTGQSPYDPEQLTDSLPLVQRADALGRLRDGFDGILVTSVEAISEKVPPPEAVGEETMSIRVGDEVAPEALMERLTGQGFEPVEFVSSPGEVATRGGILDVYPFAGGFPIRLEFFGDEVDEIREFDPANQRSVSSLDVARLIPNLGETTVEIGHGAVTPLAFLPDYTPLVTFDDARMLDFAKGLFDSAATAYADQTPDEDEAPVSPPETRYLSPESLQEAIANHPRIIFGTFASGDADVEVDLGGTPQPEVSGDVARLRQRLIERQANWTTAILCDSGSQKNRLFEILGGDREIGKEPPALLLVESLHEGFEIARSKLAIYTDHQIFDRYHRPTARRRKRASGGLTLRDVQALKPGDFVVHVDYGIGKFAGLQTITVRGQRQESVRMMFRDGDELFVNVGALHKLHKYTGKEGHQPRLTKLGTGAWERLKARTKKRVKDIARDLIKIYAARRASQGFAFSGDQIWQRELEASFQFEETPDQALAIDAVKEDMEKAVPMDRLVCGDVGFGKTEVAVRAAFKAVQDGKQVAVVVPTTILARQHIETFAKRMGRFPIRIAQMSRFVPKEEQKEIVKQIASGEVDIIIGTHRVVSKDVQFKDLGLLIVDEEQKFGVSVKEKLRKLRPNVDTLTLTATPIPRTLQFSLLGARDLSIIQTAPTNRQPVTTEIHTYSKDLIRDAILYEVGRGGQVFLVHNRVRDIEQMAGIIQSLAPDVRVRFAHGQMASDELERIMLDFMDGKFDVLVSTTIVESGLDVSNANTMIVNHAERHGLSDLHQLRGRVGRNDQRAFCYLMVPSIDGLTREARQRLQAVEEFSDLGSGINIAMRDLDIRGAGNMLGAEQSGFIEDVGFETYHNILDEAVQELRADEFAEVFADQDTAPPAPEPTVDVDDDVFIPQDYVANPVERLDLYRRLGAVEDASGADAFRDELADRFGPVPEHVETLLTLARMKPEAHRIRLPRVVWKNERLFLTVPDPKDDPYFHNRMLEAFMGALGASGKRFVMKDSRTGRLRAIVQDIPTLEAAETFLAALASRVEEATATAPEAAAT